MAITLGDIRKATHAARLRQGGEGVSTRIEQGKLQLVRVTQTRGKVIVDELTDWLVPVDALEALNSIGAA